MTWTPMTCNLENTSDSCVLGVKAPFAWDGTVQRKCSAHAQIPDDQLWGLIYANKDSEQRRVNQVRNYCVSAIVGVTDENADDVLKRTWSGTGAARVLSLAIKGLNLPAIAKASLQDWCNTEFGAGKVAVA